MISDRLKLAVGLFRSGDRDGARQALLEIVRAEPSNEAAWLWLAGTFEQGYMRLAVLREYLGINPASPRARQLERSLSRKAAGEEAPGLSGVQPTAVPDVESPAAAAPVAGFPAAGSLPAIPLPLPGAPAPAPTLPSAAVLPARPAGAAFLKQKRPQVLFSLLRSLGRRLASGVRAALLVATADSGVFGAAQKPAESAPGAAPASGAPASKSGSSSAVRARQGDSDRQLASKSGLLMARPLETPAEGADPLAQLFGEIASAPATPAASLRPSSGGETAAYRAGHKGTPPWIWTAIAGGCVLALLLIFLGILLSL